MSERPAVLHVNGIDRAYLPWACACAWLDVLADPNNADKARRHLRIQEDCYAAGYTDPVLADALQVEEMRPAIQVGDGGKVLDAIGLCAANHLVMPVWLEDEFLRRYQAVASGFARDWNDSRAFGPAYPKGTNIASVRARATDAPAAYRIACELLVADPRRPIDAGLFEAIGKRVGVGKTRAQELVALFLADSGDYVPPLLWLRDRLASGQALEAARREWSNARSLERWEQFHREMGYEPDAEGNWRKSNPGK